MYPSSTHLNIGGIESINGPLDLTLMEKTVQHLACNNDALRLLPLPDGRQQLIKSWSGELLEFYDLTSNIHPGKRIDEAICQWYQAYFLQPFALDGHTRPWALALLRITQTHHVIVFKAHHLVADGYSTALVLQKLSHCYTALDNQQTPADTATANNYCQFIDDSERYAQSAAQLKDAQYWHSLFPELPPAMLEKRHNKHSEEALPLANDYSYALTPSQFGQITACAKSHRATAYHLFIAALAIYFCRTQGLNEIVMGVPVLNRSGKRYKEALGMFTMVIPLRVTVAPADTTADLLGQITASLRGAYRHCHYPLSHLVRDLQMIQQGRDNLFDVVLSYEIQNFTGHFGAAPTSDPYQAFGQTTRYPLSLTVCEFHQGEPVKVVLGSSNDYFTDDETARSCKRIHHLLMRMIDNPDVTVNALPLLLDEEHHDLIVNKHAGIPQHPNPQPFITAFEHQAALRPAAIAIRWLEGQVSYQTVNQQANRLAHRLLKLGVKKDAIVAVVMPRQAETITAFLAVAKAGAAFVPLDSTLPAARLAQLIHASGAVVVLIGQSSAALMTSSNLPHVIIDNENAPQYDHTLPSSNPDVPHHENDLAYLLFTSGSTGQPKGVLMEHGALTRRLFWLARTFSITPKDVALQSIQLTFDPAIIEIFLPLTRGGSLALPPPGQIAPSDIAHYAEAFAATHIIFVPTTLRYFNQTAKNHPKLKLRVTISGGEVLPRELALDFVEQTGSQLFNLYGPTEACVFATAHRFDSKAEVDPLPIGEPVDDTRIYILDDKLQPLPTGTVGEIFIGGKALARGYLDQSSLTTPRFIADPFIPGERMYHSGDNGYWDDEGQIHFVGRIDNQLKLRGQRIEPGEIETVLAAISGVLAAAVKKIDDELHAWVELKQPSSAIDFKKQLRQQLPEYMIPASFTELIAMPRQVSGKLDYQSLTVAPPSTDKNNTTSSVPRTDLEKLLLSLWQEVLPSSPQDTNSDFFASGGDSLHALNLLSNIDKQIGQRLPLSLLLKNPTVSLLATAIIQRRQPLMVNLSPDENGTTVYLAASGHGDAMRFAPLADALGPTSNLQMLQPPIERGYTNYHTIGDLAGHYASLIEQRHHDSPPILAGFSIGGMAALETARHLVARGVPIGGLVLIDTTYPIWLMRRTRLWDLSGWLIRSMRLQELSINQRALGSLFSDPGLNGQIAALKSYQPSPFSLPVTLIISSGFSRWHRLLFRPWHKVFKSQLKEKHLPGFHGTLFDIKHVEAVAQVIRSVDLSDE